MHRLRTTGFELRTLDPADPDVSDLAAVREIVGDSRVVAIGESAHGVREFYQLRDRLFRYLVTELGFSALVLESGFPETLAVDEWVRGGDGDLEQLARTNITYGLGGYHEVHEMLRWIRTRNATHERPVRLYGMDLVGSSGFPAPAIEECLRHVGAEPGDEELLELGSYGSAEEGQLYAHDRYAAMAAEDRERLSRGIAALVERARAAGDEIAIRCASSASRLDEAQRARVATGRPSVTGHNPRDRSMADNVHWILERENRIVVAAHNLHIQRVPDSRQLGSVIPMLGSYLSPVLGDDLVVIGTTYSHGRVLRSSMDDAARSVVLGLADLPAPPPGSIDEYMDRLGDRHGLDLRDLRQHPPHSPIERQLCGHDVIELDTIAAYDAVIHCRDVHPLDGYEDLQRRRWTRP